MPKRRDFARENLEDAFARLKAFADNPALLDDMPDGQPINIITLPVDDPELLQHNLDVMTRDILSRVPKGAKIQISVERPRKGGPGKAKTKGRSKPEWELVPAPG